ncbi:paramyosin-like isoform X2 [Heptranchias perlo]|uniref:paramyosin-like isoform X2 n=1 Tax=Heptranchias perlo TaxID=212740 RepID=UPI003559BA7E
MLQKKLADIAAENELKQAKHVLEETKLNSQKRELLKQVEDLRGNCTSLSRDFQKMMGAARTNYEASFRRLTERIGGYDQNLNRQLEQIMVNCTPLSSNFQREVQREVDRFDAMIKGMWHQNNEQSSRIGILEKMNEECEQKAAAQSDQFRKRESSLQEDVEKYLTEKVQLLEERNKLRRQLTATNTRNGQTDSFLNPGSDRISSVSCFSERFQGDFGEAAGTCRQ